MEKNRFRKLGRIYIPKTWQGRIIAIIFITFCIHIFLFIDSKSHSVSDTFYGIFPYIIPAFLVYLRIGSENSDK